jgi:hypothetical protein
MDTRYNFLPIVRVNETRAPMNLREACTKLAQDVPELRAHLVPILRKTATEFPTQKALDEYLKEHPDADKSNHKVVESKKDYHSSKIDEHGAAARAHGWSSGTAPNKTNEDKHMSAARLHRKAEEAHADAWTAHDTKHPDAEKATEKANKASEIANAASERLKK